MYIEDILRTVSPFWKEQVNSNRDFTFFSNVDDHYLNFEENIKYWIQLMDWTIGSLTSKKVNDNGIIRFMTIHDLKLISLEEEFRENLQKDTWEPERSDYKGFRTKPNKNQKITEKYLESI
jgi:hypothetical protein